MRDIDGAIMDIGNAFEMEKRGEGRILVRFTEIKDFHIHVIFAADKLIAERPEAVRGFSRLARHHRLHAQEQGGDRRHRQGRHRQGRGDQRATSVTELMPMFSDDGKFHANALATLAKSYVELQLLPEEPDMKKLTPRRFCPEWRSLPVSRSLPRSWLQVTESAPLANALMQC